MATWKKSDDIKKLKETVSRLPEPITGPIPEPRPFPPPRSLSTAESSQPLIVGKAGATTPVFISMDRYSDILNRMEQLKDTVQSLTDVLTLFMEIDRLKDDVMKSLREVLYHMTDVLTSLDGEFVRPYDMTPQPSPYDNTKISSIRKDVEQIRNEVSRFSGI